MVVFWLLAALMIVVALAFVLVPLLRGRSASGPSEAEANLQVLRTARREIDADIAAGTLPADTREEALDELVGRAAEDLEGTPPAPSTSPGRPWGAAIAAGVAIPALALGLYFAIGNPAASDLARLLASAENPMGDKQIVAMVESLARKVRERPDDAQGWALLARSMGALGRFEESAEAYSNLARLTPGDPDVLADYADALGMAQGRSLSGRPFQLVKQALAIDPKHRKALALAGTAALDAGNYAEAAVHWKALAAELPPDSADAEQVRGILAEIGQRAAPAGKAPAAASAPAARTAPAQATGTVAGSVSLAADLASKVDGSETLFIFARAEGGPRVPLAVLRGSAKQWPVRFALNDSHAMAPGMNLSSASAVRIEARISRSGNATPQPGDLAGTSAVVAPGARDVKIVVDKVLP